MSGTQALLLAVFGVHNAEEVAFGDRGEAIDPRLLARFGLQAADYQPQRLALATAVLTGAVAALTGACDVPAGRARAAAAVVAAGALAVNGAGHLGRAARTRTYNPGLVTAPLLLATSLRAVRRAAHGGGLGAATTATCVAAGAALSLPAIVGSLRLARALHP